MAGLVAFVGVFAVVFVAGFVAFNSTAGLGVFGAITAVVPFGVFGAVVIALGVFGAVTGLEVEVVVLVEVVLAIEPLDDTG